MIAFRNNGMRAALVAGVLPLGLLLSAADARAQDTATPGPAPPAATAAPRPLAPGAEEAAPRPLPPPRPESPGDSGIPGAENPATGESTPPPIIAAPPPVTVGDLGTVEGPVAGTLDDANGGLGYGEWSTSDRGAIEAMLQHVPAATPSIAARLLLRKLVLTAAPLPLGRADEPFNALRLRKLLEGGFLADAADLATKIHSTDAATKRLQADALLYAGRDDAVCGDVTAQRLDSAESFWVELRAYCYAVTGDMSALDLTRAVLEQQGIADPTFLAMIDALAGGTQIAPETFFNTSSLHLRLVVRLNLPIPANVVHDLGMPVDLIASSSLQTASDVRVTSAERALRGGALPNDVLAKVLDLVPFKPQDLAGASAMARQEPLLNGLARLRAALRQEKQPGKRAELIDAAFAIGEAQGLLPQIAALFADDAAMLVPAPDWGQWASLMTRGLLLADKAAAAARWAALLDPGVPAKADTANRLRIALALAAPTELRLAQAQGALAALAAETQAVDVTPPALARATLNLGLFESTGRDMPAEARTQAGALLSIEFPGRRVATSAMQRIDAAALAGKRGEAALGVADALGMKGATDIAPDVIVRMVRALKTAGMPDAARALTLEALLTRPGD